MTDLTALLTRVDAATGPDRQIDCLLDCLRTGREFIEWTADTGIVGYRFKHHTLGWELGCWRVGYTASLDAALALVTKMLPGWRWSIGTIQSNGGDYAQLAEPVMTEFGPGIGIRAQQHAATPPLAVLSALLRALIAKQEVADVHR